MGIALRRVFDIGLGEIIDDIRPDFTGRQGYEKSIGLPQNIIVAGIGNRLDLSIDPGFDLYQSFYPQPIYKRCPLRRFLS